MLITEVREELRKDVILFGKLCSPRTFIVKTPPFHYEISALYHDPNINRINIIAPRAHGKTSLAKFIALHHILYGKTKIKVVLLISKTRGHAEKLLTDIKDTIEYSSRFREIYGYMGKEKARKWTENEIELPDGSLIATRGASMMIIGFNHLSQRPTLVIYDDPEDENNTITAEAMEKTMRNLMKSVEPGVDPKSGKIIVIGTPQKEGCLVEKLAKMPGWVTKRYSAIVNEATKTVLWPEWFSWKKLMNEKAKYESINRLSIFYSEYLSQLIGDEDQLFHIDDFRYWDGEYRLDNDGESYIKILQTAKQVRINEEWKKVWYKIEDPVWKPVNIFLGIDPASSTSNTADFSVIMPIAVDSAKQIYLLPFFRKRVRPMELVQAIISYYNRYKAKGTNIETVGYQEMIRDYLKSESSIYIPGLERKNNPRNAKSKRIETLQPFFCNHRIYLNSNDKNTEFLENELLLYPRSLKDDTLDGLYYAKKNIYAPSHTLNNTNKKELIDDSLDWAVC